MQIDPADTKKTRKKRQKRVEKTLEFQGLIRKKGQKTTLFAQKMHAPKQPRMLFAATIQIRPQKTGGQKQDLPGMHRCRPPDLQHCGRLSVRS